MSETPLRILMIAPTPYFSDRGCHVRIFEEARALIGLGHQVRIVSYHLGRDLAPVSVDRTTVIPWYKKLDAGPSWHKLYLDLLLLLKSMSVAGAFNPHLIHGHLHEGAVIGWFVARLHRIPLVFDYQGSLTGESLNHRFFACGSLLHRIFQRIERSINGLADMIIASSSPGAAELTRLWGVPQHRVKAFPDGVDTATFRPLAGSDVRRKFGVSAEMPLIVYLGLLNHYQGIDLLLEAAALLVKEGRAFHLLLMGFPDEEYRQKVAGMKLTNFVSFTGRVDYALAPQLLAAGDLAVSPKISDTEANGKLLNYMACGLPVVAFDTPVNWELLGEDGIYAAFGDPVDLARCLTKALAEGVELKQRGKRLRVRARELHGWGCRAAELESIYRRLLTVAK